jgi:hypothetical protein
MVAATSNVVDFAMQNQSNAALTLGCVSIAGVLTYKAVRKRTCAHGSRQQGWRFAESVRLTAQAAAVLPTVKKVVMVTAVVTAGGVAYAFSQDSSLVMATAEVWGRNGVDFVLEHPAYTLVASAGLVLVVPKLVRSLVLPALGVAGLAAAASHPSETLAIAKVQARVAGPKCFMRARERRPNSVLREPACRTHTDPCDMFYIRPAAECLRDWAADDIRRVVSGRLITHG